MLLSDWKRSRLKAAKNRTTDSRRLHCRVRNLLKTIILVQKMKVRPKSPIRAVRPNVIDRELHPFTQLHGGSGSNPLENVNSTTYRATEGSEVYRKQW